MPYPSTISSFTNPSPADKLSTTPHSSIETAQNTDLTAIETFVGTESSLVGTLFYDIRGAGSNGGGHVQTANKGGTGQTAYTKGDVLVAQSSSVLSKLGIGTDGNVLVADSSQSTGIKWGGVATAATIQNQTYTYARASIMSGSVYGIVLGQAVSMLSDGMGFVVKFPNDNTTSLIALTVNATGPSSVTALLKKSNLQNIATGELRASTIGLVTFDSVSSVFQVSTLSPRTYTNGATSKNAADASTTQNIAHGLGITPKYVRLTAQTFFTAASGRIDRAETFYNGTTQTSLSIYQNGSGTTTGGATFSLNASDTVGDNTGTVTFDNTNISIAWIKTGSPGSVYDLIWEAFG